MQEKIKKYPFSTLCIVVVWVLCLIPVPETPLNNISMIDKWTHFVMWGGTCTTIWVEYLRGVKGAAKAARGSRGSKDSRGSRGSKDSKDFNVSKVFKLIFLPVLMSGAIELAQAYCTFGIRNGDWLDFLCNAIGCILPALVFVPLVCFKRRVKNEE